MDGTTVVLTPDVATNAGSITWKRSQPAGSAYFKYMPSECRNP